MKKITLTKKKFAIVDDNDFESINKYKWCFSGRNYAIRRVGNSRKNTKIILMHRQIMSVPKGMITDHINGNGLDNRRINLRICTNIQNLQNQSLRSDNTSGYKGVCWDKKRNAFMSYINISGVRKYLGRFKSIIDAKNAYNSTASEYFGEYAKLN